MAATSTQFPSAAFQAGAVLQTACLDVLAPRPEGRGYHNVRLSGESCLSGECRSPYTGYPGGSAKRLLFVKSFCNSPFSILYNFLRAKRNSNRRAAGAVNRSASGFHYEKIKSSGVCRPGGEAFVSIRVYSWFLQSNSDSFTGRPSLADRSAAKIALCVLNASSKLVSGTSVSLLMASTNACI